jgi:hypothetical protein
MDKVALIIIFNHRYDQNIERLEEIYKSRFSHIFHLVPFYDGDKPNVIPIYGNSYFFQGYIAQGFLHYFRESFRHYFFLADDMILNPSINEDNYQQHFELSNEISFIPDVFSLDNINNNDTLNLQNKLSKKAEKWHWWRVKQAFEYNPQKEGVEVSNELPPFNEALDLIEAHGIKMGALCHEDVFGGLVFPKNISCIKRNLNYLLKQKIQQKKYALKYPLVGSYSDIVIVSYQSIRKFAKYCGAFAASELFVEFAIPTALLLACKKVKTQSGISKRGIIYWIYSNSQKKVYEHEMAKYEYKLTNLLSRFPNDKLYMHPVKLSKWN